MCGRHTMTHWFIVGNCVRTRLKKLYENKQKRQLKLIIILYWLQLWLTLDSLKPQRIRANISCSFVSLQSLLYVSTTTKIRFCLWNASKCSRKATKIERNNIAHASWLRSNLSCVILIKWASKLCLYSNVLLNVMFLFWSFYLFSSSIFSLVCI